MGGHRKPVLLPERAWLHARLAAEPDLTLRALLAELHDRGVKASYGALWLFLEREGLSLKKGVYIYCKHGACREAGEGVIPARAFRSLQVGGVRLRARGSQAPASVGWPAE
jgi:hypothetical protein